ncbi:TPA: hypothetical protein RFU55_001553 [Klebsiella aerogenes]|nr:hypothetical protein [Klebsiella aerogenes]
MNNEIQQIARQNDMSVEFVTWFFDEKKSGCGKVWFIMMAAMWEGWKAREGEATALALTLEKSREASGCPAGVDLQDWVKQLAAENVWLKGIVSEINNELYGQGFEVAGWHLNGALEPLDNWFTDNGWGEPETPATDRIVAGIKADGVEEFAKHCDDSIGFVEPEDEEFYTVMEEHASDFAKQLREGAEK